MLEAISILIMIKPMSIRILMLIVFLAISGVFFSMKNQPPEEAPALQFSDNQQQIEGTYYLFDLVDHEPEEIKQLLERAEALSKASKAGNKKTRIAMVIHGPDIEIFDKKNYGDHKELVDLAARLDATDIIDFKVCQVTADSRGINEKSFPSFMEMVPFAPDEIEKLEDEGYVEL